jgi:hypothetical protein
MRGRRRRPAQLYHLVVSGRYAPMPWLQLEAPAQATLADLDDRLRRIWLECGGHLSAFRLGGRSFSSSGAACARQHARGQDLLLPIVSSPRVGMCGYSGPGLTI